MPLSIPVARKLLHHRSIECKGYQREDGLWDIEAHLLDTKSYNFPNQDRGRIYAGQAVHDMWLRLTLDDDLIIKGVEANTDAGPYRICSEANAVFCQLIGIRIRKGWKKQVHEKVGGVKGCTHLFELLSTIATIALQTIYSAKNKAIREGRLPDTLSDQPPLLLNSCYAYAQSREVIKMFYPTFYKEN